MYNLKVQKDDIIRRFSVNSYENFLSKCKELFKIELDSDSDGYDFKYLDEDGDMVTFNSKEEWEFGVKNADGLMKIMIVRKNKEEEENNPLRTMFRRHFGGGGGGRRGRRGRGGRGRGGCRRGRGRGGRRFHEGSRHVGIICDGCETKAFEGKRFKCCDYDLCGKCYENKDKLHDKHEFKLIDLPFKCYNFPIGGVDCTVECDKDLTNKFPPFIKNLLENFTEKGCCEEKKDHAENEKCCESETCVPELYPDPTIDMTSVEESPVVPKPIEKKEVFAYQTQLDLLSKMGFYDGNLNKVLLKNHEGNIEKVVNFLLNIK